MPFLLSIQLDILTRDGPELGCQVYASLYFKHIEILCLRYNANVDQNYPKLSMNLCNAYLFLCYSFFRCICKERQNNS